MPAFLNFSDEIPLQIGNPQVSEEVVSRWRFGQNEFRKWREKGKKNFEFYDDIQYTNEEIRDLERQRRPALSYNFTARIVDSLVGVERQSRSDVRAHPIEIGDDALASLATKGIKFIKTRSHGDYAESEQFKQALICGKGWLNIKGDPETKRITMEVESDPSSIVLDPNSRRYDLSDADWLVRERWMTFRALKETFPGKAREIDVMGAHFGLNFAAGGTPIQELNIDPFDPRPFDTAFKQGDIIDPALIDRANGRAKVLEMWWRKAKTIYQVLDSQEKLLKEFDQQPTNSQIQGMRQALREREVSEAIQTNRLVQFGLAPAINPEDFPLPNINVKTRVERQMFVTTVALGVVLEHGRAPYDDEDYPFVPLFAIITKGIDRFNIRGIVSDMMDSQREINKRYSQMLNHLNRSASSGFIADEGSVQNPDVLEKFGSTPGIVVWKQPGKTIDRIDPTPLSEGHLALTRHAQEKIFEVSGVNIDALGIPSDAESGIQTQIRIRQSQVTVFQIFDNARFTKILIGKKTLSRIKQFKDVDWFRRVIGETDWEMHKEAADKFFELDTNDFDIVIDETPFSPTAKLAILSQVFELMKTGVPIPMEAAMELMDLPPEIKEKFLNLISKEKQERLAAQQQQPGAPGGGAGVPGVPGVPGVAPGGPAGAPGPRAPQTPGIPGIPGLQALTQGIGAPPVGATPNLAGLLGGGASPIDQSNLGGSQLLSLLAGGGI